MDTIKHLCIQLSHSHRPVTELYSHHSVVQESLWMMPLAQIREWRDRIVSLGPSYSYG